MTMIAALEPESGGSPPLITAASAKPDATEVSILDQILANNGNGSAKSAMHELYLTKLARLGGYLRIPRDLAGYSTNIWPPIPRIWPPLWIS